MENSITERDSNSSCRNNTLLHCDLFVIWDPWFGENFEKQKQGTTSWWWCKTITIFNRRSLINTPCIYSRSRIGMFTSTSFSPPSCTNSVNPNYESCPITFSIDTSRFQRLSREHLCYKTALNLTSFPWRAFDQMKHEVKFLYSRESATFWIKWSFLHPSNPVSKFLHSSLHHSMYMLQIHMCIMPFNRLPSNEPPFVQVRVPSTIWTWHTWYIYTYIHILLKMQLRKKAVMIKMQLRKNAVVTKTTESASWTTEFVRRKESWKQNGST